jgi:hypothetical protein
MAFSLDSMLFDELTSDSSAGPLAQSRLEYRL